LQVFDFAGAEPLNVRQPEPPSRVDLTSAAARSMKPFDQNKVQIHTINPLSDTRWDDLVVHHSRASVFHQRGWLDALARTYGYVPLALTTSGEGQPLQDGVVLCRVSSCITGTRLVSVPFADHCDPLPNDAGVAPDFVSWLKAEWVHRPFRYAEIRPLSDMVVGNSELEPAATFLFHELDLSGSLEQIWGGFHKDSIQRKIQRAQKEGLSLEVGCSPRLLDDFYGLLLKTRRRHRLVPQPRAWFRNLAACMPDRAEIWLARKGGIPIAALLALKHGSTVVYKYGCSNARFHNLGGMPFLFWKLIEKAKTSGAQKLDLGRSDADNLGLILFKERFGVARKQLTYYRCWGGSRSAVRSHWYFPTIRRVFSVLPDAALATAGRLLYRHIG
jgi:hypothetical protein